MINVEIYQQPLNRNKISLLKYFPIENQPTVGNKWIDAKYCLDRHSVSPFYLMSLFTINYVVIIIRYTNFLDIQLRQMAYT